MTLPSSSRIPAEEAGSRSQDKEKSPLLPEDTLSQKKPKGKLSGFVQWVSADSKSPAIREIVGTISCMTVIVYVSGYTLGTWAYKAKKQAIEKINEQIDHFFKNK